jgi:hypothetical protein
MQHRDILHIVHAEVAGGHRLALEFDDETRKIVDVGPLLNGPVFEPLRDPGYFARVVIDPVCGTVVWPNGADFAPEALYTLPALSTTKKAKSAPDPAIPLSSRHR